MVKKNIYYIGGKIAEEGVKRSDDEQIKYTQKTLQQTIPWINFSKSKVKILRINRAEGFLSNNIRPDKFISVNRNNLNVSWPTKLTFVPLLIDYLISKISISNNQFIKPNLPSAKIGSYPWD